MRAIAAVLGCLIVVGAASASSAVDVVALPKPGFPPPARDVDPAGARLVLVSRSYRDPAVLYIPQGGFTVPAWAPKVFRGARLHYGNRSGRRILLLYGADGASTRYVVAADAKLRRLTYAFDFDTFTKPSNGSWVEPVTWAREVGSVLYVSNSHSTYASASKGRNAYVSAIDVPHKRTLWRSRALVANARTFAVSRDFLVTGYGFTAEPDFLYLLDRKTGRVLDRLELPTAPEVVKLRGNRVHVRMYDGTVVARIVGG